MKIDDWFSWCRTMNAIRQGGVIVTQHDTLESHIIMWRRMIFEALNRWHREHLVLLLPILHDNVDFGGDDFFRSYWILLFMSWVHW